MSKRYIYLVRHGHYNHYDNPDELGSGLTLMGRDQAFYVSKYFEQVAVTAVYSSPLRRALETAEIVAHSKNLAVESEVNLSECIPIIPSRLQDSFAERFPDMDDEKIREQAEKADLAFKRFFRPSAAAESHEIVVAHGNIIRYLLCRAIGVSPAAWANMLVYHCGISRFMVDPIEGIIMLSFNELGHIPRHYWSEM